MYSRDFASTQFPRHFWYKKEEKNSVTFIFVKPCIGFFQKIWIRFGGSRIYSSDLKRLGIRGMDLNGFEAMCSENETKNICFAHYLVTNTPFLIRFHNVTDRLWDTSIYSNIQLSRMGGIHKLSFTLDDRAFSLMNDLLAIANFTPPHLGCLHYQPHGWEASQALFNEPSIPETGWSPSPLLCSLLKLGRIHVHTCLPSVSIKGSWWGANCLGMVANMEFSAAGS